MTLRLKAFCKDVGIGLFFIGLVMFFWFTSVIAFGQTPGPLQLHVSGDLTGPLTQKAMAETGAHAATMLHQLEKTATGGFSWTKIKPRIAGLPRGGLVSLDDEPAALHTLGPGFDTTAASFNNLLGRASSLRTDLKFGWYGFPRATNEGLCLFQHGGQAHGLLVDGMVAGAQSVFLDKTDFILQSGYLPRLGPDYSGYARNFTAMALDVSDGKDTFITIRIDVPEGETGAFTVLPDQVLWDWVTFIKQQRGRLHPDREIKGFWLWMNGHPGPFGYYAQSCYAESPLMGSGTNQVRRDAKAAFGTTFANADGTPNLTRIASEVDTRTANALRVIKLAIDGKPLTPPAPPPAPPPVVEPPPAPPVTTKPDAKAPRLPDAPITVRSVSVNTATELVNAAKVPQSAITIASNVVLTQTVRVANDVEIVGQTATTSVAAPSNGPAFHIPPGGQRVSIRSLTVNGGSIKFGEPSSTKPTDVRLESLQVNSTGRYFDIVGGCEKTLILSCTCSGSQEYSIWGESDLEFTARACTFIGAKDQTMVRLYSLNRVWFDQCTLDTTQPGKQTFRFINHVKMPNEGKSVQDGGPSASEVAAWYASNAHVRVTGCTIKGGRVTFGNSAERWWGNGGFEFIGNTCEWPGDSNGCIEVQPAAKNGVISDNKITSGAAFTQGIWSKACEAPNVKWSGNQWRSSLTGAWQIVPNGQTPACP